MGDFESRFRDDHRLTPIQEITKFFRFLVFELSAGVVQVLVFTLLSEGFHVGYRFSYLPALIASVLWSFTANRKFTFKSVSNIPVAMMKVALYYVIFTPASTWWGGQLNATSWGIGASTQRYIILISTMVVNFVTEFMVYRFWVYRRSINSSRSGLKEQVRYGG
ncbi:MAG: GtrA family protein [Propionibacteriaceae bacterium]|nr:GtrA family protein [Propionibacteriaceae bacterium]